VTLPQTTPPPAAPLSLAALTQGEIADGLKEALSTGVERAVSELGRDGGFLNNLNVRIPMPESLQTVERALRSLKQEKLADDFVATMNHAAEKAVPEAASIFAGAIRQMTVEDAKAILTGHDDAATQYFRRTSEARLTEAMRPIVQKATEQAGVTASYKALMQHAGPAAQFLGQQAVDLDSYITQKATDGLFKMVAAEEKRIRENPVARTTDLLKKVFGAK
jgi:hypothetical protein